ncbi:GldG family protein [Paracraurococcus lichenis]|uniref:Gldg family protein n=1 Tax=Paracraurococcus lichenis TaxID=3064888 RepID=A0ABT9DT93_9PROT|nr:Gldg family protein [Paracraurococcus sp. LOR1-02]MDO9707116.1 Gldg family protein [Paracraurococcus sp. LOR1-02]
MEHGDLDWGAMLRVAGWLLAILLLFAAGLRLPLQTGLGPWRGRLYSAAVILAGIAVAVLANVALTLNDVHIDLTREKAYTPSSAALRAIEELRTEVSLTYFYRTQDAEGRRARDLLQVMARRNPLLKVTTVDPDREPALARLQGIRLYNAAVIEAEGRRVLVQGTDETEIALGIQRALRGRAVTACFLEGHGELPMDNFEFHTHLEGTAGHSHDDASSQVIEMPGHGIGRLRRALESQGYEARRLILATQREVPRDCTLLIDANPRTTFLPAESLALRRYLEGGGAALLLFDLGFAPEPELARLLADLGLRAEQEVVIDPLSHYSTDAEMVAVAGYDPHPVTRGVSLTFYPGIRPFTPLPLPARLRAFPLLQSSRDSYTHAVGAVASRLVEGEPAGDAPQATPQPGPRLLGAAVEGSLAEASPPMRAVVIGDGDFASNSFFPYMANSDLLLGAVRWLAREERTTAVATRIPVPPLIALTGRQLTAVFVIAVLLMPLSVVLLGVLVWWRRR